VLASVIGFFVIPIQVKLMGIDAYGLLAFFTSLQTWFNLIDFGFSTTISRDASQIKSSAMCEGSFSGFYWFVKLASLVVGVLILLLTLLFFVSSDVSSIPIFSVLSIDQIKVTIFFGVTTLWLRWLILQERAVMYGLGELVLLSKVSCFFILMRYVVVLLPLMYVSNKVIFYFSYSLCVSLLECSFLVILSIKQLPFLRLLPRSINFKFIVERLPFAASSSLIFLSWTVATQAPNFLLAKTFSSSGYGLLAMVTFVAHSILVISAPVSTLAKPIFVNSFVRGLFEEMFSAYCWLSEIVMAICGSVAITLLSFPTEFIYAWTHNLDLAHRGSSLLIVSVIGYFGLSIGQFANNVSFSVGRNTAQLVATALYACSVVILLSIYQLESQELFIFRVWSLLSVLYGLACVFINFAHFEGLKPLHWLTLHFFKMFFVPLLATLSLAYFVGSVSSYRSSLATVAVVSISVALYILLQSSFLRERLFAQFKSAFGT